MRSEHEDEADHRERDREAQESHPIPWWWLGHRDPTARATAWLAITTACLVISTIATCIVLYITDRTLRQTMIAANRAWISPHSARQQTPLTLGQDFYIAILFQNTGKEPAINITEGFNGNFALRPDTVNGSWDDIVIPPNDTCNSAKTNDVMNVVHPAAWKERGFIILGQNITAEVMKGNLVLYVQGCFIYETFKERHSSHYCFFLKPESDKPTSAWPFRDCPGKDESGAN